MLTDHEIEISNNAIDFIKENVNDLISRFIPKRLRVPKAYPVTIFMAGSPGAGKTEFSERLVLSFNGNLVHIDADKVRTFCPGYDGKNAHIFQGAASLGVNKLYDYCLKHKFDIIFDGTFAHSNVESNIRRSIDKGRDVQIFYIYQDPLIAWEFTQKRERVEGRKISKEMFIRGFIEARINVNRTKIIFGDKIQLNILIKDIDQNTGDMTSEISSVDPYLPKIYTQDEIMRMIR